MVGLVAVCVALIALALLLDFLTEFVPVLPEQRLDPGLAVLTGVLLLAYPIFAVAYADYALFENLAMPGGEYVAWFSKWAGPAGLTLAGVLLMLLFPDGRLPSRRWRIVAWTALLGAALTALVDALVPGPLGVYRNVENPFGVVGVIGGGFTTYDLFAALYLLGLTLLATSSLAALFSLILRLHRARGDERQQLKWFLYPAVPVIICLSLILLQNMIYDFTTIFLFDTVTLVPWEYFPYLLYVTGFALLVIPVCTYIAILRHHLYDIDVVINRTLVYGALTALLLAVYVGSVVSLQGALRALTGQESQLAVVASTLAVAAVFSPLRRRIQAFVDRRFYRRKYDAAKTMAQFSSKLRDGPGHLEGRSGRGGVGDDATGARLAVATPRSLA
jgi:MFS family permease